MSSINPNPFQDYFVKSELLDKVKPQLNKLKDDSKYIISRSGKYVKHKDYFPPSELIELYQQK